MSVRVSEQAVAITPQTDCVVTYHYSNRPVDSNRQRDLGKEQWWREVFARWRQSGQSVSAFCRRHNLSQANFYAWRRTLARRDADRGDTAKQTPPAFLPVHIMNNSAAATFELVLRDGQCLRLPANFDADSLRRLLAVLAEAPSC